MEIVRTVSRLQEVCNDALTAGKTIGLVPTMGALHAGHVSLLTKARAENNIVVASVFVNPTQFNNPDDLRTYPRTEEADCAKLEAAGTDYAFIPSVEEIYPEPDTRIFDLGPVANVMEGAMRPGHFNGVAQIVSKLFQWVKPSNAYFGEKDFQQIAVIRKMAEICNFTATNIVACPIVREADGLALSSRNVRLDAQHRLAAPHIRATLLKGCNYAKTHTVAQTQDFVKEEIGKNPLLQIEYFTIAHPLTMQPITDWADAGNMPAVGCITVFCGDVRLIDNIQFD